jgi:hypothetical protein
VRGRDQEGVTVFTSPSEEAAIYTGNLIHRLPRLDIAVEEGT